VQHTATYYNTLQHTVTHCNTLQHTATHCNTLQHATTHCNALQHTATRTATHGNTLTKDENRGLNLTSKNLLSAVLKVTYKGTGVETLDSHIQQHTHCNKYTATNTLQHTDYNIHIQHTCHVMTASWFVRNKTLDYFLVCFEGVEKNLEFTHAARESERERKKERERKRCIWIHTHISVVSFEGVETLNHLRVFLIHNIWMRMKTTSRNLRDCVRVAGA